MIYLKLFWSFLQVGLFSIGGGDAAIPLIQNEAVANNAWLSMTEFTDLVTIAEMTPGPIGINAATFVGIRIAGIPGALIATFGFILPSCLIVSILAVLYRRYKNLSSLQSVLSCLRPVVVALIAAAALSVLQLLLFSGQTVTLSHINWLALALFVGALFLINRKKLNPILTMFLCGGVYLAASLLFF